MQHKSISRRTLIFYLIGSFCLAIVIGFFAPLEKSLGTNLRLVYLHGAWVWTGILTYTLAGLIGLAALIFHHNKLHKWSHSLGWSALCFWITSLLMSLAVMQINWNGFFFDEPRWKVPFTFAVISVLLQAGLLFMNTGWMTSIGNFLFGSALLYNLMKMDSILHPVSPVFSSGSSGIKWIFLLLLGITLTMAYFLTCIWMKTTPADKLVKALEE